MKKVIARLANPFPSHQVFNVTMLFFRIAVALEMIIVHGFKKLGIGTEVAEKIPNPLQLPGVFNTAFAIAANIFFPFLVLIGLYTRLATLPTLAVTLTGYFILHWNDAVLIKDTPFIYSAVFMLILMVGPGKYSFDFFVAKKLQR